jgi:cytochrome c556
MMRKLIVSAALGSLLITSIADAQERDPIQAEIKYRQAVYTLIGAHFGPIGAMMRGRADFDLAAVQSNATTLSAVAPLAVNSFTLESHAENSDALSAIWENRADFDEKMNNLQMGVAGFAEAAATATGVDDLREAFGNVGGTCKACHDDYRAEPQNRVR